MPGQLKSNNIVQLLSPLCALLLCLSGHGGLLGPHALVSEPVRPVLDRVQTSAFRILSDVSGFAPEAWFRQVTHRALLRSFSFSPEDCSLTAFDCLTVTFSKNIVSQPSTPLPSFPHSTHWPPSRLLLLHRVLQVGDASGIQSPLSFGGFGAITRHLGRLTAAVSEALEADVLDKDSLALIHAYNPGLSSAWMLQRAMSVRPNDAPPANLINRMMR